MAKFNVGYPQRTGDIEKDMQNIYDFVCELSDRLAFILNVSQKPVSDEAEE